MGRKPRRAKKVITGTFAVDTGTARIVADSDRDGSFLVEVNNVPSSHVVLGAPEVLYFDYMRWMVGFLPPAEPFHAVHLGGAGCALPAYVAQRWASKNTVVELDRGLAALVQWAFAENLSGVQIVCTEARRFTHALPKDSVDVLIRDVFAGPDTPRPLRTVEFFRACFRALRPGGIFLANVGDDVGLPNTRAELAGLARLFRHTAAVASPEVLGGRGYGNVVLAASNAPLLFDAPPTESVVYKTGEELLDAAASPLWD